MSKILGYLFLAITAIVGLFSAYQIQNASDTIAEANKGIKQQKAQAAKAEQYVDEKISAMEDEMDPVDAIKFEEERQQIEDDWSEETIE